MGAPLYLSDFLHFENRQRTLRSETMKFLHSGPRSKINYMAIHHSWLLHRALELIAS